MYLFESQQKVIDTVYEHNIDINLFLYMHNVLLTNSKRKCVISQRKCALCVSNVPISK